MVVDENKMATPRLKTSSNSATCVKGQNLSGVNSGERWRFRHNEGQNGEAFRSEMMNACSQFRPMFVWCKANYVDNDCQELENSMRHEFFSRTFLSGNTEACQRQYERSLQETATPSKFDGVIGRRVLHGKQMSLRTRFSG
jgi:hypothetical protein